MLLQKYKCVMNYRFKLFARSFGIFKHQSVFGNEYPAQKVFVTPQIRYMSGAPINTVIMFVPQQEVWIVERMGKFHKILEPGLNVLAPIIDRIKYVQSLKEIGLEILQQNAVTSDSATLTIDAMVYLKIHDPYLASYGTEDPEFAIIQLAQATMKSELGKISLSKLFRERENLNTHIVDNINKNCKPWGITCLRYEIRDIKLPTKIQEALEIQLEAERKKMVVILESEGAKEAEVNIAEGKRLAQILASEAAQQEEINRANGEAAALVAVAEARAKSLKIIANALSLMDVKDAAALSIAEQYVQAFNKLAKVNNTLILPSNVTDVPSLVTHALAIYKQVMSQLNLHDSEGKTNQNASLSINDSDECFEYFSDKEEAEKHRKTTRTPKV